MERLKRKNSPQIFITFHLQQKICNLLVSIHQDIIFKEVAIQSRLVELPHQDPADRFLAATAIVYDLILVTTDTRIIHAKAVPVFEPP
jgi:PIN domain nuclease of toxin-antitoxin system